MSIKIEGKVKRIGLTLSGGGFRAAGFHLGVMRKLQELNLLDKIDLISCVSGGSIAGSYLALNWQDPKTLDNLENYLNTKSIAVSSFFSGLLNPFKSRLDKLANSYDNDLFHCQKLEDFPSDGPRIYLNSTCLVTGNMFFFVAGGGLPPEIGEHELGVVKKPDFSISKAVAASSAFPPVFPPLKLDWTEYKPNQNAIQYITLTDGGVYDNLGINPALRERNNLDYVIISDGGKPFENDSKPTGSGAVVLRKSIDILMEQVRGLQFDRSIHRYNSEKGPKPIFFSIDSNVDTDKEEMDEDARFASSIKTHLKALNETELTALQRHGAALVQRRIQDYATELLS